VPLRSDTGANLWIGNHAGASGTSFVLGSAAAPTLNEQPPGLVATLTSADELGQNEILTLEAWRFARREPVTFAKLYTAKLWYFWWRSPHTGVLMTLARWCRQDAAIASRSRFRGMPDAARSFNPVGVVTRARVSSVPVATPAVRRRRAQPASSSTR
jgi:hypothetical protein